jgi:hypothetical protein
MARAPRTPAAALSDGVVMAAIALLPGLATWLPGLL